MLSIKLLCLTFNLHFQDFGRGSCYQKLPHDMRKKHTCFISNFYLDRFSNIQQLRCHLLLESLLKRFQVQNLRVRLRLSSRHKYHQLQ
jgi:hypothetical protein